MAGARVSIWPGVVFLLAATGAAADDFRIHSRVYLKDGRKEKLVADNLTLFANGVFYDQLAEPKETIVFDATGKRFLLLDPQREVRCETPLAKVRDFALQLRAWAATQDEPLLSNSADAKFDVSFDEDAATLTLRHELLNYSIQTLQPKQAQIATDYREFSDAYVQLHAMLHPGGMPPFYRQQVNAALAERSLLPRRVELTIDDGKLLRSRRTELYSTHHVAEKLLDSDRRLVRDIGDQLAAFRTVSLAEYRAAYVAQKTE